MQKKRCRRVSDSGRVNRLTRYMVRAAAPIGGNTLIGTLALGGPS